MAKLRLGQVDYINCMTVNYALEEGQLTLDAEIYKAPPVRLNELFLNGELDIAPLSPIEYARHADKCCILPNIAISFDGKVANVILFSRVPVTELEGKKVAIMDSATTSESLLKILLQHYYHVDAEYLVMNKDLENALTVADAVLLIGDDAMITNQRVKNEQLPYIVTDLGTAWKNFTGQKMVFSVWAVQQNYADDNLDKLAQTIELFNQCKALDTTEQLPTLVDIARRKSGLPQETLEE